MLKLFTSAAYAFHHVTPAIRVRSSPVKSPLFNALTQRTRWNQSSHELSRRAFSSDSEGSDTNSSAIVSKPNLNDCLTDFKNRLKCQLANFLMILEIRKLKLLALPLRHKPLIPGFYMPIYVKDPKLLAALQECRRQQASYAGAFLLKDDASTDSSSSSETEEILEKLKGKELLNRIHEIGTLAQISSIQGEQIILVGRRRLKITEMVSEDPLTVKVDHLKDKPYDRDDDVIKETYFEVMSTLRDVLRTTSLWRDQVQTYTQHIGDFNYQKLADFGTGISGANKHQNQRILEELDVHKCLDLTLEVVKKEVQINNIQKTIAKTVEDKFSGEKRHILLKEQLTAIKRELGVETDSKSAFCDKLRKG